MRISKTMKVICTALLVGVMALSVAGCTKKQEQKTVEKVDVLISAQNGISLSEPFAHLLTVEGMPEDATANNTFIIPSNVTPRIKVVSQNSQKVDLTLLKNLDGKPFEIYKDQILIPLSNTKVKYNVVDESGVDKVSLEVYKIEITGDNVSSNYIYLIPKQVDEFFTPTDLKLIEEAKKVEEEINDTESETEDAVNDEVNE